MKFTEYLKDKIIPRFFCRVGFGVIMVFLSAFKVHHSLIVAVACVLAALFSVLLFYNYFSKRRFYSELARISDNMDKAYLVPNIIDPPGFYEGRITADCLGDMSKSMRDAVRRAEDEAESYKEYIEMWVHEVKVPLAALMLSVENGQLSGAKRQIDRIETYLEQVLYYTRSENSEKDYIIAPVNLGKAVKNAAIKNMSRIRRNNIDFRAENLGMTVMSDVKWLEFIIGQIIANRVKYKKEDDGRFILCSAVETEGDITMTITDNGIGIPRRDLPKVFDKSFTGQNGRKVARSTGMGLFIVKNLCRKLGIKIDITSEAGKYTAVSLYFAKNEWYKPVADIS